MNSFHPATAAALVGQHRTDTSDRVRHTSPTNRPAWWTRVTAPLLFTPTPRTA